MPTKLGLQVTSSGGGQDGAYTPVSAETDGKYLNTNAPYLGPINVALAAGDNTLNVPANAIGIMIVPSNSATNDKTLKGVGGDTGILLKDNYPLVLYFGTTVTSLIITSVGTEQIAVHWL